MSMSIGSASGLLMELREVVEGTIITCMYCEKILVGGELGWAERSEVSWEGPLSHGVCPDHRHILEEEVDQYRKQVGEREKDRVYVNEYRVSIRKLDGFWYYRWEAVRMVSSHLDMSKAVNHRRELQDEVDRTRNMYMQTTRYVFKIEHHPSKTHQHKERI